MYSVDRLLLHLKRAGKLDRLAGLMIGEMEKIGDDEVPFGYSVDELVVAHCAGTEFPIISQCPFGHGVHQLILPIGAQASLWADDGAFTFELVEAAVICVRPGT